MGGANGYDTCHKTHCGQNQSGKLQSKQNVFFLNNFKNRLLLWYSNNSDRFGRKWSFKEYSLAKKQTHLILLSISPSNFLYFKSHQVTRKAYLKEYMKPIPKRPATPSRPIPSDKRSPLQEEPTAQGH